MRFVSTHPILTVVVKPVQHLVQKNSGLTEQYVPAIKVHFKVGQINLSEQAVQRFVVSRSQTFKSIFETDDQEIIDGLIKNLKKVKIAGYSPAYIIHPDDDPQYKDVVDVESEEVEEELLEEGADAPEKADVKVETPEVTKEEEVVEETTDTPDEVEEEEVDLTKYTNSELVDIAHENFGVDKVKFAKAFSTKDKKIAEIARLSEVTE